MTPAELLEKARAKSLRLATAESCTGGMVTAALTAIPGSSDVVECGFVTYSNEAKKSMLGVQENTLLAFGAVSEETAAEMARGARRNSEADLALSITGIAGPGGSDTKPEGRVCFGLATSTGVTTQTVEFGAIGRAEVRQASVEHGMAMLAAALDQH